MDNVLDMRGSLIASAFRPQKSHSQTYVFPKKLKMKIKFKKKKNVKRKNNKVL